MDGWMDPSLSRWYHYDLSRHAAEALLLSNGSDGSYLLRNSNEGPGCFALSVRAKDSVKHFHVTRKDNGYVFGFNTFATLHDFINHFANQPLVGSETGTLIVLKYPYPWRVEEPSIYESVRVHTALQTGRTENDLVANAPSLGTKEGYLLKQGAIVKSWKQRWFTLSRNELKYFKDQVYEEPIRTLDLKACSAVQFDYSQERINCFCLVFPERTFYLCAKTGVEADEWIKILRWKLRLGNWTQSGLEAVHEQFKDVPKPHSCRHAPRKRGRCLRYVWRTNNTASDCSLTRAIDGLRTLNQHSLWGSWMDVFGKYKTLISPIFISIAVFAAILTWCGCCCIHAFGL
ncbi:dual adapter for phosphotyrosine and 3-phosphotyrosine and 3-phosphoinositide isoform X2 [Phyllopteryx taeniolatus]|uniref:dual adapter for phosphotyrosine and 3-phosphotyrosine and 3-phosphoinositide isoform X2 n=1 Tax=Phyllopteryx taeniolatus TaxID=161469 RepID=UPI002AD497D5|nr:dual adapter for phosphotyrosine and 3-phosphotyrosine and 3-phosphoinositide isoform X2 [Phyllopteryx taeniolatus]